MVRLELLALALAGAFLAAALLGARYRHWRLWDLVDLVYYPLGALGVVLLAFNLTEGEADRLRAEAHREAEARLEDYRQRDLPQDGAHRFPPEERAAHRQLLQPALDRAESCETLLNAGPRCTSAKELAAVLEPHLAALGDMSGTGMAATANLCGRFLRVLDHMAERPGAIVGRELHRFARSQMRITRPWEGRAETDRLHHAFAATARQRLAWMFAPDTAVRRDTRDLVRARLDDAALLLRAFSFCFRLPEAVRLDKIAAWLDAYEDAKDDTARDRRAELEEIDRSRALSRQFSAIRDNTWPFVLILALALKFGRGVAHYARSRKRPVPGETR